MRHLIAAIGIIVGSSLSAQDRVVLVGTVIDEQEHDRTLISNPSWLRGIHIVGTSLHNITSPRLLSVLPADWTKFCGKVTSIGGDYTATIEFATDQAIPSPQPTELSFETDSEFPTQATHETGGVVLEQGTCADSAQRKDVRRYIASLWNAAASPQISEGQIQVVLNMNVARAEKILPKATFGNPENSLPVDCTKLTSPDALAFNYRCSFFVPENQMSLATETPVTFSYERFFRGSVSKARFAQIFVGASQ